MSCRIRKVFPLALLIALAAPGYAGAAVQVLVGPTPIPDGDARSAGDITVVNDRLAFAIAVDSAVPFGIPRGALIDAAPVSNGNIGRDRVVYADFIPNDWRPGPIPTAVWRSWSRQRNAP